MLNINRRISLSRKSKRLVKLFLKKNAGVLNPNSWSQINKGVKNDLSKKLLALQQYKCVFCERYLLLLGHEMDHFVNKAYGPEFTFNPVNIFYACGACNSSGRKGQKNVTVPPFNIRYDQLTFSIIHPYRNDVDNEIRYKDHDKIDFDWDNCTDLGKATIEFFGFDDLEMTTIRSRQLIFERQNPLTTQEQKLLIQKAIAYT